MKEYGGLAKAIICYAGGPENILHVTNCMTRVRLEVADQNLVEKEKLKALKGVLGIFIDAQVQIIVGPGAAQNTAAKVNELLGGKSNKELA